MITVLDKNTALVLIDLQKAVLRREAVHPVKDVIEKSATLVAAFRKAGLPIVVVSVNPFGAAWLESRKDQYGLPKGKATQTLLNLVMSVFGLLDTVKEIKTQPDDIFIIKKTWNAFYNTALHNELQKRSITGIVMAGVSTSIGVEGTARAASELGYNLSFATDAMTDTKMEAHTNSINVIFPRIGEVGKTIDIIEKLSNRV
jgi:nicotinamidase-related amidase